MVGRAGLDMGWAGVGSVQRVDGCCFCSASAAADVHATVPLVCPIIALTPPLPLPHPPPGSYEVLLPDKTHLQLTAAAQLGRVYALAATAPDALWGEGGAALREAALSFRLRYKL